MDINSFLQDATSKLGVSDDAAKSATGALLGMVKDKADPGDFSQLMGGVPGAESLLSGVEGGGGGGGGMLGGLGKAVSGALGDKVGGLGGAASMMGAFDKSGLDLTQVTKLATMFFSFAKTQAGDGLVEKILGKVPEIKKLIG